MRLRDVKFFVQRHIAGKWQSWALSLYLPDPRACPLNHYGLRFLMGENKNISKLYKNENYFKRPIIEIIVVKVTDTGKSHDIWVLFCL